MSTKSYSSTIFPGYYIDRFSSFIYRITFVGVIFHEFSHAFFISIMGYKIHEINFFSHVKHESPDNLIHSIVISFSPLVINSFAAAGIVYLFFDGLPGQITIPEISKIQILSLYIVVSLLIHAIPSLSDVKNIKVVFKQNFKWYRIDLLLFFLPVAVVFVPIYVSLAILQKIKARFILDFSFLICSFIFLFNMI